MRRSLMGLATAALLLGSAGSALAVQQAESQQSTTTKKEVKESTVSKKEGQEAVQGKHELVGKIAAIEGDMLYLSKNNAIIPVKVEQSTMVGGKELTRSKSVADQLKSDFREGEEVRTSFSVENNTENVAKSVSKVETQHHGSKSEMPSQHEKGTK